jgi:hypothetical protein
MTRSRVTRHLAATSMFLLAAAVGACSDSNNNDGGSTTLPASTTYVGLMASTDGETGPLNITFASAVATPPAPQMAGTGPSYAGGAPVAATATMQLGASGVVNLAGTLDAGALSLSGSGWTHTGTLSSGKITGTFTGPGGKAGSMSAASNTTANPARAYCGTFTGTDFTTDPASADAGTFSAVVAGSNVTGTAVGDGGTAEDFTGVASPSKNTFTVTKTTLDGTLSASGSYGSTETHGTYTTKAGSFTASSGTFTGSICGAS